MSGPHPLGMAIYKAHRAEIDQAVNEYLAERITPFTSYDTVGTEFNGEDMADAFVAGVTWAVEQYLTQPPARA